MEWKFETVEGNIDDFKTYKATIDVADNVENFKELMIKVLKNSDEHSEEIIEKATRDIMEMPYVEFIKLWRDNDGN